MWNGIRQPACKVRCEQWQCEGVSPSASSMMSSKRSYVSGGGCSSEMMTVHCRQGSTLMRWLANLRWLHSLCA